MEKKKHSFFADTKLQVDQFKGKLVVSSISYCLFKNQIFSSFKASKKKVVIKVFISFRVIDDLILNCLGSHLNLSPVSIDLNCSVRQLTQKGLKLF